MKKQIHVHYTGRVQGVGFRFTAEETAQRLGVMGWIKNLRDGRVELIAEGREGALTQFLDQMRAGPMRNFIEGVEVTWRPGTGAFHEFEVRYF